VLTGTAWLVLGALVGPAVADTPEGGWETPPEASAFEYLLILAILPLAAAAVIALLAVLPSIIGDKGYEPGQSWRGDTEWFGGPTKGVKAADEVTPEQIEQSSQGGGGTSGRW
jgi:hypothetical protein